MTRASEIKRVGTEGKRIRTAHCDVRVHASLVHLGRVGIIVPKHGRPIVQRNRLKRRLGELVRTELLADVGASDVLIRALPAAYRATFDQLRADVIGLRQRFTAASGGVR